MVLTSWLWLGCGGTPEATIAETEDAPSPTTQMPSTIEVTITPPVPSGQRFETETVARILRTIEGTLLAVPRVVPRIGDVDLAPGIEASPQSALGPWSLSFAVSTSNRSIEMRLMTCAPNGGCEEDVVFAEGTPESIGGLAVAKILDRLDLTVAGASANCMSTQPSKDDYHSLIAGRGAAVVYGLLEPTEVGDRDDDPSERAIYLDPKSGLGNWMAARARFARGALDSAETAVTKAVDRCPGHLGIAADAARIALELDKVEDAIALLEGAKGSADDPRLMPLWLDAWVRTDRIDDAETLGLRANATFPDDPNVARVLAELAKAQGHMEEYENWVQAWSDRSNGDPEPARRLIGIMARDNRWKEAWSAISVLESRGAAEEARQWKVTAGLALERYRDAAEAADPVTAKRIQARAALEGLAGYSVDLADDPTAEAHLARAAQAVGYGENEKALAQAEAALRLRPYWPEALEIKAEAMRALGRNEQATVARNQWLASEPPLEQ
ncbi:MAG: hypothetical protein AAGA48_25245 [Myxococcota bacterium]